MSTHHAVRSGPATEGTALVPAVGDRATRRRRVEPDDIDRFAAMTGDRNPLHTDPAVAAASRFGGLIVQGGVITGLLNAVVAEDLPGPGTVFLSTSWQHRAPARPGDLLIATVEVLDARDDKPVWRLRTEVHVADPAGGDPVVAVEGEALVWRDPVVAALVTTGQPAPCEPGTGSAGTQVRS